MLENPELLMSMVEKCGAKSTDLESPETVEHLCGKCALYASEWKSRADRLWEENSHFGGTKYMNEKDEIKNA